MTASAAPRVLQFPPNYTPEFPHTSSYTYRSSGSVLPPANELKDLFTFGGRVSTSKISLQSPSKLPQQSRIPLVSLARTERRRGPALLQPRYQPPSKVFQLHSRDRFVRYTPDSGTSRNTFDGRSSSNSTQNLCSPGRRVSAAETMHSLPSSRRTLVFAAQFPFDDFVSGTRRSRTPRHANQAAFFFYKRQGERPNGRKPIDFRSPD